MLYQYQKSTNENPSPGHTIPNQIRFLPTLISAIGLGLVATVIWPLVNYNFSRKPFSSTSGSLLSPLNYQSLAADVAESSSVSILGQVNYTRASNWFVDSPTSAFIPVTDSTINGYSISIPSLDIEEATVRLDSEDLSQSLIHYPQTALPGQYGSPVIFGHSTLPQFFDPLDYASIFSTLPTIQPGASIFITSNGIKYTYKVNNIYQVKPDQVEVLRQEFNEKTLKLITCVPPGTKLKRLVVEAVLQKI
ncbi:sortase [Patescibacteria group bacterium]|nr:sortase [Patescibacteria group bacterium]